MKSQSSGSTVITLTQPKDPATLAREAEAKEVIKTLEALNKTFQQYVRKTRAADNKIEQELKERLDHSSLPQEQQAMFEKIKALLEDRFADEKKPAEQDDYNRDTIIEQIHQIFVMSAMLPSSYRYNMYKTSFQATLSLMEGVEQTLADFRKGVGTKYYVSGYTPTEHAKLEKLIHIIQHDYATALERNIDSTQKAENMMATVERLEFLLDQVQRLSTVRQLQRLSQLNELKEVDQRMLQSLKKIEEQWTAQVGKTTPEELPKIVYAIVEGLTEKLKNSRTPQQREELAGLYKQLGLLDIVNAFTVIEDAKNVEKEALQLQQAMGEMSAQLKAVEQDKQKLELKLTELETLKRGISARKALDDQKNVLDQEKQKLIDKEQKLTTKKQELLERSKKLYADISAVQGSLKNIRDFTLFSDLGSNLTTLSSQISNSTQMISQTVEQLTTEKIFPTEEKAEFKSSVTIDALDYTRHLMAEIEKNQAQVEQVTLQLRSQRELAKSLLQEVKKMEADQEKDIIKLIKTTLELETDEDAVAHFKKGKRLVRSMEYNFTPDIVYAENYLSFVPGRLKELTGIFQLFKHEQTTEYQHHINYFNQAAESHLRLLKHALEEKDPAIKKQMLENLKIEFSLKKLILESADQSHDSKDQDKVNFFQYRHALMGLPISPEGGGLRPLQACLEREKQHVGEILKMLDFIQPEKIVELKTSSEAPKTTSATFVLQADKDLQKARDDAFMELKMIQLDKDYLDRFQAISWATHLLNYLDNPKSRSLSHPDIRKTYLQILDIAVARANDPKSAESINRIQRARTFLQEIEKKDANLSLEQITEKINECVWRLNIQQNFLLASPVQDNNKFLQAREKESHIYTTAKDKLFEIFINTLQKTVFTDKQQIEDKLKEVNQCLKNIETSVTNKAAFLKSFTQASMGKREAKSDTEIQLLEKAKNTIEYQSYTKAKSILEEKRQQLLQKESHASEGLFSDKKPDVSPGKTVPDAVVQQKPKGQI